MFLIYIYIYNFMFLISMYMHMWCEANPFLRQEFRSHLAHPAPRPPKATPLWCDIRGETKEKHGIN